MPPWRCSVLYHGKNDRLWPVACSMLLKRAGKRGWYFRVLNLRFRERVVIGDLRPTEGSRDSQVREELGCAFARHRRSAVGVKRQYFRRNTLFIAGLFNQTPCESRVLTVRHHPTHGIAAEDVEQDVEVVVGPLLGA